jgi:hypothetical protein
MKKIFISLLSLAMLAGCSFLAPYSITFTTPAQSAVNPATDTLDLALSQPAMAYISGVDCEGHDPIELLPVVNANMESSNVHNLTLELLDGYEATTECSVTVMAFDQTTTANSSSTIALYVLEKPAPEVEYAEQIGACEEAGGSWNECGSACADDAEICVEVCVPQCEFSEEEPVEEPESLEEILTEEVEEETEELVEVTQETCVADGGQWNNQCDEEGTCSQWCQYAE